MFRVTQQKFRSSFICKPYVGHLFCSCCRRGSAKAIILTLNFNRSFRRRWNFCIFILENATGEQYLPVSTLVKYKNYLWANSTNSTSFWLFNYSLQWAKWYLGAKYLNIYTLLPVEDWAIKSWCFLLTFSQTMLWYYFYYDSSWLQPWVSFLFFNKFMYWTCFNLIL